MKPRIKKNLPGSAFKKLAIPDPPGPLGSGAYMGGGGGGGGPRGGPGGGGGGVYIVLSGPRWQAGLEIAVPNCHFY